MTCIAGIAEGGKVYIGADSAATDGDSAWVSSEPKIFRRGEMLFGIAGDPRLRDIMRYAFDIPGQIDEQSDREYLNSTFTLHLRAALQEAGFLSIVNSKEDFGDSEVVVGYRGSIYWLEADFHLDSPRDGILTTGSGGEYARGALLALDDWEPMQRIKRALTIAATCSTTVGGPFKVISL